MICPDCNSPLEVASCKGVMIHECRSCKGKWFQRHELKQVQESMDDGLRWLDFDPFGDKLPHLYVESEGKNCPRCRKKMESLRYRDSRVAIDKCSACKGVWLTSGELVKVIRYLEGLVNSQKAGDLARATFQQFIEVLTGPKGAAEEVKDLWAVLYILEVRIGIDHPQLAALTRKLYEFAPYV